MAVSDAQRAASERYNAQTRAFHVRLRKDLDAGVISWLEGQENVTGAIRDLVRREVIREMPRYPQPSAYLDSAGLHLVIREGREMVYAHTFPRGTFDKGQALHERLVGMYTGCEAWRDWGGNDLLDPDAVTEDVEPRFREGVHDVLQTRYTVDLRDGFAFGHVLYATDSREDAEDFARSYDLAGVWELDDAASGGELDAQGVGYMLALTEWGDDGDVATMPIWQYSRPCGLTCPIRG